MKENLKLFVWEDVLYDYTAGMAVALAPNVEKARQMLLKKIGYAYGDLLKKPKVRTAACAFYVHGGG